MSFNSEQFAPEPTPKALRRLVKNLGYLAVDTLKLLNCAYEAQRSAREFSEKRKPWGEVYECDVISPPLSSEQLDDVDRLDPRDLSDLRQLSRPSFGSSELLNQIDDRINQQKNNQHNDQS